MVNLDETRALQRIAHALEKIADMKEQEPVAILSAGEEPGEFEALPVGGVPIMLIVQVLFALIRLVRHMTSEPADEARLRCLGKRLEPYLPEAPSVCLDGKEAE